MKKIPKDMQIGSVHVVNCGTIEIVDYKNKNDVLIKFMETKHTDRTTSSQIRSKSIKNKMLPTVYGVGFVGVGGYKAKTNGRNTRAYAVWHEMIRRCYISDGNNVSYKGCTVCEEWHNFQNFAEWFYENYPSDGLSYDLDKDMKVIGNKTYSPSSCWFIKENVNSFVIDCLGSRGSSMIGSSYVKRLNKYQSYCNNQITGNLEYLGVFYVELDAHLRWRKRKSEIASMLIDCEIHENSILALANYKFALDNNLIHQYHENHPCKN